MPRRTLIICLGLVLLTIGLFFPATHFDFITYDDQPFIVRNPHVITGLRWANIFWAFSTWYGGNWEPLTWISHMVDSQIFGANAGGHHLINILFHLANTILVFLVLFRLTGREWPSAFVAALFAIHPLHVESVAWISERKDVLSAFFFLLSLEAYRYYVIRPGVVRYIHVALWFLLGISAKPIIVLLPFVLLLLDFWPLARLTSSRGLSRLIVEKLPFVVISAIFIAVTFSAQKAAGAIVSTDSYPLSLRFGNVLISYAQCLKHIFWPHDLTLPYPLTASMEPWRVLSGTATLLLVCAGAVITLRRYPYFIVGWLWFLGMLAPMIALIQFETQVMPDRFSYLPAIGIFIAVTWSFAQLTALLRRSVFINTATGVTLLTALTLLAWIQLSYWKDGETLFKHSLAVNSHEVVALQNLGYTYALRNRMADAVACLSAAVDARPLDPAGHLYLGQLLEAAGNVADALDEYYKVLRLHDIHDNRNVAVAFNNIAWIRSTAGDETLRNAEEGVRMGRHACEISRNATHLDTLAAAYANLGEYEEAQEIGNSALELARAAGDDVFCPEISERLNLYRQRKPYRVVVGARSK